MISYSRGNEVTEIVNDHQTEERLRAMNDLRDFPWCKF